MADINLPPETHKNTHSSASPRAQSDTLSIIEHLFFAYRDFVAEPDAVLADLGFGRAHHRVLHFVHRNPGMTVAVLLETLQITKQSLARVLKNLIENGYIAQKAGPDDRRQRLLYTSQEGAELVNRLIAIQSSRIEGALGQVPANQREGVLTFLRGLMNDPVTPLETFETIAKTKLDSTKDKR